MCARAPACLMCVQRSLLFVIIMAKRCSCKRAREEDAEYKALCDKIEWGAEFAGDVLEIKLQQHVPQTDRVLLRMRKVRKQVEELFARVPFSNAPVSAEGEFIQSIREALSFINIDSNEVLRDAEYVRKLQLEDMRAALWRKFESLPIAGRAVCLSRLIELWNDTKYEVKPALMGGFEVIDMESAVCVAVISRDGKLSRLGSVLVDFAQPALGWVPSRL